MNVRKLAAIWKKYTVINDKAQSKHLSFDGLLHYTFIVQFPGERIFYKKLSYRRSHRRDALCQLKSLQCHATVQKLLLRQELLLIVVVSISKLTWVYDQQISNCCRVDEFWFTNRLTPSVTDQLLIQQFCTVDHGIFIWLMWSYEHLFASELNNAYFTR